MAITSQPGPVLEFLTTTLPFHEAVDDDSRRIVRSHAIRDANRRKRMGQGLVDGKARGGNVPAPAPQSKFTTKFRLDTKSSKRAPKSKSVSRTESRKEDDEVEELPKSQPWRKQALLAVPGTGNFDPFETFPIKLGPKQQALMHYQKVSLKQNAFAFYSKEQLFAHAVVDPAWLNATLSLIALHHDLNIGKGISQECLFHRGEALRIVNERLKVSRHVNDSTIGAIASLANFDITNGLFMSATMHISGLEQILADRGAAKQGLLLLSSNALVQKVVAWSDLSYSTTWDLPPRYPLIRNEVCTASLPDFITLLTPQLPSSLKVTSPHDLFGEISDIFQSLRLLSYFMSRPSIDPEDQLMFTRGLYITEYKLLIVLDQNSEDDFIPLDRNSHLYGSTRLATYLYLYMALRELPRTTMINYTLARRLKGVLERNNAELLVIWKDDLHLLLWILFIGGAATLGTDERVYFVGHLKRTISYMGLDTLESFGAALTEVLWLKDFCGPEAIALWKETREASCTSTAILSS